MGRDVIDGDVYVNGNIAGKSLTVPAGTILDAQIAALAGIKRTKCEDTFRFTITQTGAIVAQTAYLQIVRAATADLLLVSAAITEAIATGADRTVTIDVQYSRTQAAFVTCLTSTIVLNNNTALLSPVTRGPAVQLLTGDIVKLVVTVAGAAGNQAQGLCVTVTQREDPT